MTSLRYAYHEPDGSPCKRDGCGLTRARHRVRHPPGCTCGASHKGKRSPGERKRGRKQRRYIIGLDGEGIGRKPHRYTLLAWSDKSGKRSRFIQDLNGLSTERCLEFLTSLPVDAKPFGYYLGYDWTMILRDLPDRSLYRLFRPGLRKKPKEEGGGFTPVYWRGFQLHWLGGMLRVKRTKGQWTTVWDVGKFYQQPFVEALRSAGIDVGNIADMKLRRDTFSRRDASRIREYCLDECRKLAELVEQLNAAHEEAELPLKSWHGPGSAASVLLGKMGIRDKRGEIPDAMRQAVSCAFFGGRFEHSCIGRIEGPIYGADIVSAYPAECLRLPCLEHAEWYWTEDESELRDAEQACVRWELAPTRTKRAWGPLPCRLSDGSIVYPRSGASGWTWLHEWRVARKWPQTRFRGAWVLRRSCDCVPFAEIRTAFETRLRVGKKTAVGGALKRSINSVYGKLAQSVGDPPFRSQVWAGMITSGCRARLLDVIWRYDSHVLAVATDGVLADVPLKVREGEDLGEWETDEYKRLVLVRPGIYWTERDVRSRGLPRKTVDREKETILAALDAGQRECMLPPVTQFGAAKACVYECGDGKVKRSERYGEWYQRPARVSFTAMPKRQPDWSLWELSGVDSAPYNASKLSIAAKRLKLSEELGEVIF